MFSSSQAEKVWTIFENATGTRTHSSLDLAQYTAGNKAKDFVSPEFSAHFERRVERAVDVTCKWGDGKVLYQRFISPFRQFDKIHEKEKFIHCLDVTSGGLGISGVSEDRLFVWDTTNGEIRRHLKGHFGDIYCAKFFPCGTRAVTCGADLTIRIWAVDTGVCSSTLVGHVGGINDILLLGNGEQALSCSRDGTIRLWDVATQQPVHIYEIAPVEFALNYPINGICLTGCPPNCETPNDQLVIAACESGRLVGCMLKDEFRQKLFDLKLTSAVNCCASIESIHPYHVICGTQDGQLYTVDVRRPDLPVCHIDHKTRGAILSMKLIARQVWITASDGSAYALDVDCFVKKFKQFSPVIELTGADCEPVTNIVTDNRYLYTSCRDGNVRKYTFSTDLCNWKSIAEAEL